VGCNNPMEEVLAHRRAFFEVRWGWSVLEYSLACCLTWVDVQV
jgi:hypothetical protein